MTKRPPNIVVLSTLYPSASQPYTGVFIRERMARVARELPVTVVAPVPWFPLDALIRLWRPQYRPPAPRKEVQNDIVVLRPRFFCIPGLLKRADGLLLALCCLPVLAELRGKGRLDVLDAHFAYPEGYAASLLGRWLGVPVTITLRGTEPRHIRSPVLRRRVAAALRGASRIFAVAGALKRTALSLGIPEAAVRVIGNGVDTEVFHPIRQEDARDVLGLPRQARVLITVGGLVERKGFHRVIACVPELLVRFPDLHYLIVGGASAEGDMTQALVKQVADLGLQQRVHFLGPMASSKLHVPLSAADVFVLSTRNEGWANVLLEAMACGLPVVATDVGGNPEVVARPQLGLIIPFGDHAALTQALDAALRFPWDRRAIRGYAMDNSWTGRVADLVEEFQALSARAALAEARALAAGGGPDPYAWIASRVLFPLHERLKRHDTVAVRRRLEATQWWTADQLDQLQRDRLRSLLRQAYEDVPYYRRLFDGLNFDPDVSSIAELQRLPLLDKATIRANAEALRSRKASDLLRSSTGGSSGEPLVFWLGRERVSHDVAAKWRATRWWGVDIGDPEVVLWGSPIELAAQDRVKRVRDQLLRTTLLPAFEMSDAKVELYLEEIRSRRPRMLFGYPSALAHLAAHAQRTGRRMDDLGIRVAFVTSERLYDHQRQSIERVFACRVANGYGGRDAGFIAHECPEGRMHITAEDLILEIVDADGRPLPRGMSGEIVVTHLATRDFPFIRYRTGDIGVVDTAACPCGRGLPVLKEVHGRSTDFVVAQDGTVMHGLALIYILREMPEVAAFRIEQERLDLTRVAIVPGPGFTPGHQERIATGFKKRLGMGVSVQVDLVDEIKPERSGKFRYVVSRVDPATREVLDA